MSVCRNPRKTPCPQARLFEPDIVVVCEPEKLDEHGCVGAPTLVVEILSPHTARKDLREKLYAYEQAGVREYWVVFPSEEVVNVFSRDEDDRFGKPIIYLKGDQLPVGVLPAVEIDLERIFAE